MLASAPLDSMDTVTDRYARRPPDGGDRGTFQPMYDIPAWELPTRTRTGCVVARHGGAASCNAKKSHHAFFAGAMRTPHKAGVPRRSMRTWTADSAGAEAEPEPTAEPAAETLEQPTTSEAPTAEQPNYVRQFKDIGMDNVAEVGGKNASLGEMFAKLSDKGVRVPDGFATTASAYREFLCYNDLTERITEALEQLDVKDVDALSNTGATIRRWIVHGDLPPELAHQIAAAYRNLEHEYGPNLDVAVRSSATAEDLPGASFAGQQETYLNIRGVDQLLHYVKQVMASLFTNRAISYRVDKGFEHMSVAVSIGVQKMVRSDVGCAGVMFTLDPESGFRDVVLITSAYGLGENVVQGSVNPDEWLVFKPLIDGGITPDKAVVPEEQGRVFTPIIRRHLGEKAIKMIYNKDPITGQPTTNVAVRKEQRQHFSLRDDQVLELARYAVAIESHYSELAGHPRPMDIEWAMDGTDGKLYVVQARPETVHASAPTTSQTVYHLEGGADPYQDELLCFGRSIGSKVGVGKPRVVLEASHMNELKPGEILVTDITDPDWEPVMKIAGGIVTNRGGRTCHAAILARELGIPAVVGTGYGTAALAGVQQEVTVSCCEGDVGAVYRGKIPHTVETLDFSQVQRPSTKMMLIVGNPEQAFDFAALPNDGVGLARLEFIIANHIGIHPQACVDFASGNVLHFDNDTLFNIERNIIGYKSAREFFVQRLAQGIAVIAAAFYPKPVVVRTSDFKSNEYAHLVGGGLYEPKEENPMLGWRGASRYPTPAFKEAFQLECEAIRHAREIMGLDNVQVMLPFVRTVHEQIKCLSEMARHGLKRGEKGLQVHLMCEVPSNALLADEFLNHVDGFSIGSNDLLQLTLGVDRDNAMLTGYDERNPAVLRLAKMAIEACVRRNKYIGICGQAPSDYPEITAWLVKNGCTSMALQPDVVLPMTRLVMEVEAELKAFRDDAKEHVSFEL